MQKSAMLFVLLLPTAVFASAPGARWPTAGGGYIGGSGISSGNILLEGHYLGDSTGPTLLGASGTTSHSLTTGGVLIDGALELDDTLYADGDINAYGNITMSGSRIYGGNGQTLGIWVVGNAANSYLVTGATSGNQGAYNFLGTSVYRTLHIADYANVSKDPATSLATDPTVNIYSATSWDSATNQYLQLVHNQTNGVVATGVGGLVLSPASGGVQMPTNIATGPTEPVACGSTTVGFFQYVDKTDDSGAGAVCVCIATGDDGAGTPNAWDWVRMDNHATTCFY